MAVKNKPLWKCPRCGERFVTANVWHSCGKFSLKELFARSEPQVFRSFKRFRDMVRKCGPAKMIPQKTRVVFQVRMRFAGCYPRKSHLVCTLVLRKQFDSPRFSKIEKYGPYVFLHYFKIFNAEELDEEVQEWLAESYLVGKQE